ncbi:MULTISPECIES: hydroxypyruvate isomerase family protein [unclassified Acinetobacter]|uniref:hydroxypyruvate isomerase family protein n=1 Tax=unclassified Acinetobacter TaxID=196816 RepID=UPI002934940D|nr:MULTISPECIES: TIM barrel protein [unclassified Acinetobacter]WOE31239.1 TIM barrel protein [Acinetobacter sp. SAAs470]WOE39435.1 TIM barrel protein [Acinetobacter sp. SAAs474]
MNRLAVNLSMIFTEVPLMERFALAKKHGFQHVEIQFPYSITPYQILEELEKHQLSLCLINVPVGDLMQGGNGLACVPGKSLAFRQALEHAITYAKILQVPNVNILAGRQPQDANLLSCLNTYNTNLKLACARLSEEQIQPVFEMINGTDMPRFLIQNIAQAQDILDAVQHPALKMQFDCYHMAMMDENILDALKENIQHIGHIQFADAPNRHQPDHGSIDYQNIFSWLKQSTYSGFIAAEYHPLGHSEQSFAWKDKYFSCA